MMRFKWKYLNYAFVALATLAVTLTGCVDADRSGGAGSNNLSNEGVLKVFDFPTEKSLGVVNGNALFEASDLNVEWQFRRNGQSVEGKNADQIQLTINMCNIKDRATNGDLTGQLFIVESELNPQKPQQIPQSNCLRWTENLDFNFFAPSYHLVVHYRIRAYNSTSGHIIRRLSFNPWEKLRPIGQYVGHRDISELDRDQWPLGRTAIGGKNVMAALKGKFVDPNMVPVPAVRGFAEKERDFPLEDSLADYNSKTPLEAGDIVLEDWQFSQSGKLEWDYSDRVELRLKMCGFRDWATKADFVGQMFVIESELRDQPAQKIPQGNCIRWKETVDYDYFAPSYNLVVHYRIRHLYDPNIQTIRRITFNPWDKKRSRSSYSGFADLTNLNRNQWPLGRTAIGETKVASAMNGRLKPEKYEPARLFSKNFSVNPQIKEGFGKVKVEENGKFVEKDEEEVILSKLSEEQKKAYIEMRDFHRKQKGVNVEFTLKLSPSIRVEDSQGHPHDIDLDEGSFKVYMQLVATGIDGSGKTYIIDSVVPRVTSMGKLKDNKAAGIEWKNNENGLLVNMPVLLRYDTRFGNVALAVKVVPEKMPSDVKPLSVVYDLGNYNQLMKGQSPAIKATMTKFYQHDAYDAFVASTENYENLINGLDDSELFKDIATFRKSRLFLFESQDIRFVRILPGETATDRTFMYAVTSCVKHALLGTSVGAGYQFDITTWDYSQLVRPAKPGQEPDVPAEGMVIRRETDENGCLTWFGNLSHKYYRKEVLFPRTARVKFVGVYRKEKANGSGASVQKERARDARERERYAKLPNKFDEYFDYFMNPWDEKFTFGWDARNAPENYLANIEKQKVNAPLSRLFVADFKYETMGFRYEIDRFMNLKVKKTVLFKTYPEVLKYNSIVRGRSGTERLRDGVYLMKVALQKDYLDPAARGVKLKTDPAKAHASDPTKPPKPPRAKGEGVDCNDPRSFADCKSFISVQEKLVRVIGGIIVTPIEFEISDLRLMRIRNLFFIQLQTIDENRLRLATLLKEQLDQQMNGVDKLGNALNSEETFEKILDVSKTEDEIGDMIAEYTKKKFPGKALKDLKEMPDEKLQQLFADQKSALEKLTELMGFDNELINPPDTQTKWGKEEYQRRIEQRAKFVEELADQMAEFRDLGVDAQNAYRNYRKDIIEQIVKEVGERAAEYAERAVNRMASNRISTDYDPVQKFFYTKMMDSPEEVLTELFRTKKVNKEPKSTLRIDEDSEQKLKNMKFEDFVMRPLAPNFDFDILRNDYIGPDRKNPIPEFSGLESRTFVGPLTFLHNSNGSSLRPTDILNEKYCLTATCTAPDRIEGGTSPSYSNFRTHEDKKDIIDRKGEEPDLGVYEMGDTVNADYENNRFHGYMKAYFGMTVDKLIKQKKKLDRNYERQMEAASQIYNFVEAMNLRFVSLNDSDTSVLKWVDQDCVIGLDAKGNELETPEPIENCFKDVVNNKEVSLDRELFLAQLNDRDESRVGRDFVRDHPRPIDRVPGVISEADLEEIMTEGTQSDEDLMEKFYRKMCFVLSQNALTQEYLDKELKLHETIPFYNYKGSKTSSHNITVVRRMIDSCNSFLDNIYNKTDFTGEIEGVDQRVHPPIVIERKVRVYDTTKRYYYRGGKSLNINVATSFSLSHSRGYKDGTSVNLGWDPIAAVKDLLNFGDFLKSPTEVVKQKHGETRSLHGMYQEGSSILLGGSLKLNQNFGVDDSVSRADGTNVSSQTFLVSQQATLDIEIGEYERCMVVRLGPKFLERFVTQNATLFKEGFQTGRHLKNGIMICTGRKVRDCLPVKEKYYYFTQHFTEGDMLDPANLHNHPWLLQIRGYRDFQTFVSSIGARKNGFLDYRRLYALYKGAVQSAQDNYGAGALDGKDSALKIADRQEDMIYPLRELGRVYFNVSPTFPGLYTFIEPHVVTDSQGRSVEPGEFPELVTYPGKDFKQREDEKKLPIDLDPKQCPVTTGDENKE